MSQSALFGAIAKMAWTDTRGRVAVVVALSILTGLTEGVTVTLLIPVLAAAQPEMASSVQEVPVLGEILARFRFGLTTLLAAFIGLVTLQACLTYARSVIGARIVHRLSDTLSNRFFEAVSLARWNVISQHRLADINQVLTSGITRTMVAVGSLFMLVQAAILIVIYMALAAAVSWRMSLFVFVVGSALYAVLFPLRRAASDYGVELTSLLEKKTHSMLDFLTGIRFAKSFLYEDKFVARFSDYLGDIRTAVFSYTHAKSLASFLFQVGGGLVAAGFVYIAVERIEMGLAELGVLLVIFARLLPRFRSIQEQSQEFLSQAPAYGHYANALEVFTNAREVDTCGAVQAPVLNQAITLNDVSLEYKKGEEPALNAVTLIIRAKRITALVGASGSGKSTLVDIVSGLIGPTSGTLAIDGKELGDANRRAWRERVAIVPQDAFLFDASLRENLALAKPTAQEAELWKALELAQIDGLVHSLPDGLDTNVGHRGTRFSGGERQRLAIARALLSDPEILILDEATSALDQDNERKIAHLIAKLAGQDKTILLVSHNQALAQIAHEQIHLDAGRVVSTTT